MPLIVPSFEQTFYLSSLTILRRYADQSETKHSTEQNKHTNRMTRALTITTATVFSTETMPLRSVSPNTKRLSRLSSGDLKVKQQVKFKTPRSRSNSPVCGGGMKRSSMLKRSPLFQEKEAIRWKHHGVTNDAWDRSDPSKNIGGACYYSSTPKRRDSLARLSPHLVHTLAHEDFALLAGERRTESSNKHQSMPALARSRNTSHMYAIRSRNAQWGSHQQSSDKDVEMKDTSNGSSIPVELLLSQAESVSQVLSEIDLHIMQ